MMDLETVKSLLKDPHHSIAIGKVVDVDLAEDNSTLRVMVSVWPDEIEVVCRVAWAACSSGGGIFMFPQVNDLVVVKYPDDDEDLAIVTERLSSSEDFIPAQAADGSVVVVAAPSKNAWLCSDTKINLSRSEVQPTENLVLGQAFKAAYLTHLDNLIALIDKMITQRATDSNSTHLTIGLPSTPPLNSASMIAEKAELETLKAEVETFKTNEVESENFLSDLAFTEK